MYRSVAEVFADAFSIMAGGQIKQTSPADDWEGVGECFRLTGADLRWAIDKVAKDAPKSPR